MKILSLLAILFLIAGCGSDKSKPNVELVRNMMESPAIKAQDYDPSKKNEMAMRLPPENAVAIGKPPYKYKGQPVKAGEELKNPLAGKLEVLARGKILYNTYCSVCHGDKGLGKGTVADKMIVKPPSLHSDKVLEFSDGRIYHIIMDGQGLMSSYASQVLPEDGWKIVNYIRNLQKESKE